MNIYKKFTTKKIAAIALGFLGTTVSSSAYEESGNLKSSKIVAHKILGISASVLSLCSALYFARKKWNKLPATQNRNKNAVESFSKKNEKSKIKHNKRHKISNNAKKAGPKMSKESDNETKKRNFQNNPKVKKKTNVDSAFFKVNSDNFALPKNDSESPKRKEKKSQNNPKIKSKIEVSKHTTYHPSIFKTNDSSKK